MKLWISLVVGAAILAGASSCTFNLDLGTTSLFPTGTSFVLKGTADMAESDATCPVWRGDNGVVYYLFQTTRITNEEFDRIATPGVTSRLELATRTDLASPCAVGAIVEVKDVLETIE